MCTVYVGMYLCMCIICSNDASMRVHIIIVALLCSMHITSHHITLSTISTGLNIIFYDIDALIYMYVLYIENDAHLVF